MVDKQIEKKPIKKDYDVTVNALVPIQAKYRVNAFSEKEAIDMIKTGKIAPRSISKPIINAKHIMEMIVYIAGTINKIMSIKLR